MTFAAAYIGCLFALASVGLATRSWVRWRMRKAFSAMPAAPRSFSGPLAEIDEYTRHENELREKCGCDICAPTVALDKAMRERMKVGHGG